MSTTWVRLNLQPSSSVCSVRGKKETLRSARVYSVRYNSVYHVQRQPLPLGVTRTLVDEFSPVCNHAVRQTICGLTFWAFQILFFKSLWFEFNMCTKFCFLSLSLSLSLWVNFGCWFFPHTSIHSHSLCVQIRLFSGTDRHRVGTVRLLWPFYAPSYDSI